MLITVTLSDKVAQVSVVRLGNHIKKSSNWLEVTRMNIRGDLFICGLPLQSITFLLCIQLKQTSDCMSMAKLDSFRIHRTLIPWTCILAKLVSDRESPVVPCPHALAHTLKFVHVGWNRWKMHPLRTDLSKTKQRQNLFFSWVSSPILFIAKNICVCQKEMETWDGR